MYLKSLELQGFKSFPDKIKLTFDKGLTAVVGPNGSGKSNIGDAMRWVLGEQSTKTLRGNKMEDIIFSGTVARKQVGFAAVTLTIDNESGRLPYADKEVSVTRKLYRNGESEYRINGQSVRLKDINELFMDTGLGRDGYSIIGQGRIAEIVGAKSNERRDIFEEAAGISKFRYRKQEAERKLGAAQDNLLRLHDIVSELEQRVEPLRVQAGKAEKFLTLAEERKKLEISVWVNRLDTIRAKLDALAEQVLIAHAEYDNTQNDIDREEQKIAEGYQRMQECTIQVEQEQARILQIEQSAAGFKAEIAVCENDISHAEAALASIATRKEQAAQSKTDIHTRIATLQTQRAAYHTQAAELLQEAETAAQQLDALREESDTANREYDEAGVVMNALYLKQSESTFSRSAAEEAIREIEQQLAEADSAMQEQSAAMEQYKMDTADLQKKIQGAQAAEMEQSNRLNGFQRLFQGKSEKLAACRKEYEQIGQTLRDKQHQHRILQDLEQNMEGFGRSVKEILRAAKQGKLGGIHGSVSQIISVAGEYGIAIETALGAAMQNLVVDNEDIAKRGIRYLKEQRAGRATFLPLTAIRGQRLSEPRLAEEEGFVALACDLVQVEEQYKNIIHSLLGRIAIAEDIDVAAMIAKKYGYKFRIVTLDGQVINAGGSFTGGSVAHTSGVITRKNEITQLATQMEVLRTEQAEQQKTLEKLKAETDQLSFEIEAAREALSNATALRIRYTAEQNGLAAMVAAAEEQLSERDARLAGLQNRRTRQEAALAAAKELLTDIQAQIAESEASLAREQGKRESMRARRGALSERYAELKLQHLECEKDMENVQREATSLQVTLEQSEAQAAALENERQTQVQLIADRTAQIAAKRAELDANNGETAGCREKIKQLQTLHNERQQRITQLREGMRALTDAKEKLSGEATRLDERKLASQKEYDEIILQLLESYELTRTEAEQLATPVADLQAAQRTLQDLKGKIRSLGNVNVGAIDEYREVSERYQFLSAQVADVTAAKQDLEKLIAELTADMCRIFAENFVKINRNFKEIFVELFGGGKAELILTDPEHVLESGIEISVAPPGKVIKNLISLSGGEQSFVAICIYFAILKLRPAPFCILDEIDAALDEVNVKKYAQYLKQFTDHTQFVLVTHRRSAMEEANVLYGVTMQEDGISRLLKMEQSDIANTEEV